VRRFSIPFTGKNKKNSIIAMAPALAVYTWLHRRDCVIECGNIYAALLPWIFRRMGGLPYHIYTYGTELLPLFTPSLKSRILFQVLTGADKLYSLGPYTSGLILKLGLHNQVEILPPKIVPHRRTRKESDGNDVHFRILSIGRLVEHKGHSVLLEAVGMLPPECDWELSICGEGPKRSELERQCAAMTCNKRIKIKGYCTDEEIGAEYSRASVFIFPSLETRLGAEGFGIVLLEAMAHRIPIIASETGGIGEVLDNGSCGILVKPGDPEAIALAIKKLWIDKTLGLQLTETAGKRLDSLYTWYPEENSA
jgi:glycosyltransferase involved in cell wall biosynthesis